MKKLSVFHALSRALFSLSKTTRLCKTRAVPQSATQVVTDAETQLMNRDRLCHSELVSESQGCVRKARRLGFNPTSSLQGLKHCPAFSLVEMLMALLVASLLMAALAPVMTKRMDEAKINISGVGAAQFDKDALVTVFTGEADEDKEFFLPDGVSMMKVTLIGGGGAGGNSFYGKDEITETKTWTVPQGVTKLRVFMLGGGGGGASGGLDRKSVV